MAQSHYHIQNNNTKFFPLTRNESENQIVQTADGKQSIPADSILGIYPAPTGNITIATIAGPKGLHIAPQSESDGSKLIWTHKEYKWIIRKTGAGTFQITPADGKDLYWIDKFGIGNVVEVRAGKNIVPPENDWTLIQA